VAGHATADFDPQAADRQVEFVMDNDDPGRIVHPMPVRQFANRLARLIHEGLRNSQRHSLTTDADLARQGKFLGPTKRTAVAVRQDGDDVGTHVVARAVVVVSGISEAYDQ
jgi:hypothetical protein